MRERVATTGRTNSHGSGADTCPTCEGVGWITVPEHSMYCNGYRCDPELCPVPTQVRCPECDTEEIWPTSTTTEEPF